MDGMLDFLKNNFFHIAPILLAGAFAIAIILERTRALYWVYPLRNESQFFERIHDLIMADRLSEAIAFCDQYRSEPIPKVVRAALLRAHQPEIIIEDGLSLAVSEAGQQIQKRTQFLATIANVATLLGLFGTIAGLIYSFQAVGTASAQQKSALLASGISTAMNATMMGLGVAIPCMVAFSFLMNRTNWLSVQIDQSAVRIMDIIRQRYYAADTGGLSAGAKANRSGETT